MRGRHLRAGEFLALLSRTQAAYERRDLSAYLDGFSGDYSSVTLGHEDQEDRTALERKIRRDLERFDVVSMEFSVLRHWYAGDTGFAHLRYSTELRFRESGRSLLDRRENLIVGRFEGDRWSIVSKIVLRADSRYADESVPPPDA